MSPGAAVVVALGKFAVLLVSANITKMAGMATTNTPPSTIP
jgi:hypothetical protein